MTDEVNEITLLSNGEVCMQFTDEDGNEKHSNPNCPNYKASNHE